MKSKQTLKWQYSRKQIAKWCETGIRLNYEIIERLLAKQPQENIKEIKPFKHLFIYSKDYSDLCAEQTPEFREWVKQVTDKLNNLDRR